MRAAAAVIAEGRSQLDNEYVLRGGEERLTEPERASIAKGRSFAELFSDANNVRPLPWRLPGAKCDIAYVNGDSSPWCRCATMMPASMEVMLKEILDFEGPSMHYHERVAIKVLDRPSVHSTILLFKVRIVPMLPPFEWCISATWAASITGGRKAYIVVFLPSTARTSDAHAASTFQLMVLQPGNHVGESHFTYLFQLNFGAHMAALERFLPKARIAVLRNHRELVACMKRHHSGTFWRSQLHAELALGGGLDRLTVAERASIDEGRSFEAIFNGIADVRPLPWRLPGATCDIAYKDGDPNPWCRCAATIPAAVGAVLEGVWEISSEAMRYNERVKFQVLDRPSAHSVNFLLTIHVVPMMPPFEWRLSGTWAKLGAPGGDGCAIVFLPTSAWATNDATHSVGSNSASALHLVSLKPGARANTTEWTLLFQIDLGSHVNMLEKLLPNARVEAVRRHRALMASFQRHFAAKAQAWLNDVEDDRQWRDAMVETMRQGVHACSEEESALIAQGAAQLDVVVKGRGKVRPLKLSKTAKVAQTRHDTKSGRLIGEVECYAHGTSPEQIVAYLMHFDSRIHASQLNPEVDVRHELLEVKNLRYTVAFSEMRTAPLHNRTFMNALVWQKVSDAPPSYVWVAAPIKEHSKVPARDEAHAVRAEVTRCCRITLAGDGTTKMEYVYSASLKGNLPHWFANNVATPALARMPLDVQRYFLQLKPPGECAAEDGELLGHMLADLAETTKEPGRAVAFRMFVERTATLRECGLANLESMLCGIFNEKLLFQLGLGLRKFKTVSLPEVVADNPAAMTTTGAAMIGRGLESMLRTSATPAEAIHNLLRKYPALDVLAQRHVWLQPMLETIAKRRMARSPFGLRFRLTIGAGFSIADMVSDINNIVKMLLAGQNGGAYALLGLILASLAFQVLVVIVQNSHRGRRVVAWEIILVLSLLKAGVGAKRVAGGEEQIAGCPFDPVMEMVACKLGELALKSIPGAVLQAIFLISGGWTMAAVLSIVISCLSTAFTATMLTYDLDTSVERRRSDSEFYG
jgi:hypothetical protein